MRDIEAPDTATIDPTKTCSRCGRKLPAKARFFYRDKYAADGYKSDCKRCNNDRRKSRKKVKKVLDK